MIDRGFGFAVELRNVPMIRVRDVWTPEINFNALAEILLKCLSEKAGRLTGHEIRFVRQHFEMTLAAFATRFSVSHVAVLNWEKCKGRATQMNWATEKDIRLFIFERLKVGPKKIADLYSTLEKAQRPSNEPLSLDLCSKAA